MSDTDRPVNTEAISYVVRAVMEVGTDSGGASKRVFSISIEGVIREGFLENTALQLSFEG